MSRQSGHQNVHCPFETIVEWHPKIFGHTQAVRVLEAFGFDYFEKYIVANDIGSSYAIVRM